MHLSGWISTHRRNPTDRLQQDGKVLTAGVLNIGSSLDANYVARINRLNRDGSLDSEFHPELFPTQDGGTMISSLIVLREGKVFV